MTTTDDGPPRGQDQTGEPPTTHQTESETGSRAPAVCFFNHHFHEENETMKAIKIKLTKAGDFRAYYYSRLQYRWFPMPLAEAELLLAAEKAYRVPANQDWA